MNAVLLVSLSAALAQDPAAARDPTASPPRVVHQAVTEIDFVAQDIHATASGPGGTAVLVATPAAGFAPMIPLRLDFDAEMRDSTRQIH